MMLPPSSFGWFISLRIDRTSSDIMASSIWYRNKFVSPDCQWINEYLIWIIIFQITVYLFICLYACVFRSISTFKCRFSPIGCSGVWADTTMAVFAWTARWFVQKQLYSMGRNQWRIQAGRPRHGGETVGRTQSKTKHELRQTQQSFTVSNSRTSI